MNREVTMKAIKIEIPTHKDGDTLVKVTDEYQVALFHCRDVYSAEHLCTILKSLVRIGQLIGLSSWHK